MELAKESTGGASAGRNGVRKLTRAEMEMELALYWSEKLPAERLEAAAALRKRMMELQRSLGKKGVGDGRTTDDAAERVARRRG